MKRTTLLRMGALLLPLWIAACDGSGGSKPPPVIGAALAGAAEPAAVALLHAGADARPAMAVGSNGRQPIGIMEGDASGNLYGVTQAGGANDMGTIFRINPDLTLTVLHSFSTSGGRAPQGGLVSDASGHLYGVTRFGGAHDRGTVFRYDPATSTHRVIHSFRGVDGKEPLSRLTLGPDGALYGTTRGGGANDHGAVFKVDISGAPLQSVIYSFADDADGNSLQAGVSFDQAGNLYGSTPESGASSRGTLWRIDAGTTTKTTLFSFDAVDERQPFEKLAFEMVGNGQSAADRSAANDVEVVD